MEVLFNELSLYGQYRDCGDFIHRGLKPFLKVTTEMKQLSVELLKKCDTWNCKVTGSQTLNDIIRSKARKMDELRKLKLDFASLIKTPFWDIKTFQNSDSVYILSGEEIAGTSLAEACCRGCTVVSFGDSPVSCNPLLVYKDEQEVSLHNFTKSGELSDLLWQNKEISFEQYLKAFFHQTRLDFSKVLSKYTFDNVDNSDYGTYIGTLKRFCEMHWDDIYKDRGLDYKKYNRSLAIKDCPDETYKFRVSQKMRCHGYRKDDKFVVLAFESDHKLSDKG